MHAITTVSTMSIYMFETVVMAGVFSSRTASVEGFINRASGVVVING